MPRVLVTGCAGFIGSNLCAELRARGSDVVGVDNLLAGDLDNLPEGVAFHQLDVRDPAIVPLFAGADAVFHLAARNCIPDCAAHPEETASINVGGTVQVLEACRRHGVGKLIYADTSAEYEGIERFPTPETEVCPLSAYAVSKRAGALLVESCGRLHGLKFTILRYFNVYGPAQDHRRVVPPVMSAFISSLLRGERPRIHGTGEKRRDFIHVDDVNRFHVSCLEDDRTDGRTFNVGTGENHSILEVFELVERRMRTGLRPEFHPELPGEARQTLADISAARRLGFRPRIALNDGIASAVRYLQDIGAAERPVGNVRSLNPPAPRR